MSLRAWLRRAPQPTSVRITDVDGAVRDIVVTPGRNCWKNVEQAVTGARAVNVEALDPTMKIIRSQALQYEDDDASSTSSTSEQAKTDAAVTKAVEKDRRELAGILDRYGDRLNEAFKEGAASSNNSHDTLVGLVETLTAHLSAAITNLHTISVAYSRTLQESKDDKDPNDDAMAAVLAGAAKRWMSSGGASDAPAPSKKNGKG